MAAVLPQREPCARGTVRTLQGCDFPPRAARVVESITSQGESHPFKFYYFLASRNKEIPDVNSEAGSGVWRLHTFKPVPGPVRKPALSLAQDSR